MFREAAKGGGVIRQQFNRPFTLIPGIQSGAPKLYYRTQGMRNKSEL